MIVCNIRLDILLLLLLCPLVAIAQQSHGQEGSDMESGIGNTIAQSGCEGRSERHPERVCVDSLLTPDIPFTPMAVSVHGYTKKHNEVHETFILRNDTGNYRISRVMLRLLYTNKEGDVIADRYELVECDIAAGAKQTIKIRSFEGSAPYYYYKMPPTRRQGTPFKLSYDIVRYDVVVTEESDGM